MQKLGINELRERFLKFFEGKEHLRLSSFPLIPQNDAGLLLINSGMAPLKPYFTGAEEPPRRRVTTCQKCIRTPDIENVGKTARHGTFFEMLGNFSFGNYFKTEATDWAWEFITKDMEMQLDKLWVSIYEEDDEAFDIWTKSVGVPADRIVRMGKKDNFWEIGTGPCGPCSEIYFDRGEEKGCGSPDCKVGCDCDRYIEFWNLVFTQFSRDDEGNYTRLKNPNIDTGMGLERLGCIMQGVDNLFEVDTIQNILQYVCKKADVKYRQDDKTDVSIRVITDHIRSTTMMIADGVIPSNEGRGYVLRRLLRRAARHGKLLGINKQFLYDVAKVVINESKDAYPELEQKADYIQKVIRIEEEKFEQTIDQGLVILNDFIKETKKKGSKVLAGELVFKLHSTYGFPVDLTREISEENGLGIDEEAFKVEMANDKKMAKEALKNKDSAGWGDNIYAGMDKSIKTEFVGYKKLKSTANILYMIKDDGFVNELMEGDEAVIILDVTPCYAESGGQVGDTGVIAASNSEFEVVNTTKTPDGKYLHTGIVKKGILENSSKVTVTVDSLRRKDIARNHTTTHLLHKALKNHLGTHVNQAGSSVDSDRLRFDFSHFQGLTAKELADIENEVNEKILEGVTVKTAEMSIDEAKKKGATALFGEKYGNTVRVVTAGNYSMELCGGTHLTNTAEAGLVKIISESGVAAGVRGIEALTGLGAINYYKDKEKALIEAAAVLKASPNDIVKKAETIILDSKNNEKEIEKLRAKIANSGLDEILSSAPMIKGVKVVTARFDHLDMDGLRSVSDTIKNKIESGVVVLASGYGDKVSIIVSATKDVLNKGVHSGNIIKEIAKIAGGGGGGRPDMAQAGAKDVTKINEVLEAALKVADTQIKG